MGISNHTGIDFKEKTVTFHEWPTNGIYMTGEVPIQSDMGAYNDMEVEWQYQVSGNPSWIPMNRTKLEKVFVIHSRDPNDNSKKFDKAIEYATDFADGESDIGMVCKELAVGVSDTIYYDPSKTNIPQDPIESLEVRTQAGNGLFCAGHSETLKILVESSTSATATNYYVWGGLDGNTSNWFKPQGGSLSTVQFNKSTVEDAVGVDPYFTFHSLTAVNDTWYDASYGTSGAPSVKKLAHAVASPNGLQIAVICANYQAMGNNGVTLTGLNPAAGLPAITQLQTSQQEFTFIGSVLPANHPYHTRGDPDYRCPHVPPPTPSERHFHQ